jgi:hypothetical protein
MTTTTLRSKPVKRRLSKRINFRLLGFSAFVLLLIGYPMYIYLHEELTGGIVKVQGKPTQVDLRAMSLFNFDQINGRLEDVPAKFRELDGTKVILTGEMYVPDSAADDVDHFQLCYSIAKCCFSGPPQVQHFVISKTRGGQKVPHYGGLVSVTGTLHVKVIPNPAAGKIDSVYQMEVDQVEPM